MTTRVSSNLPHVLYVGAVSAPKDGTKGGQLFATRSLMATPIRDLVTWQFVDSSQKSQPPPGFFVRAFAALSRVIRSTQILLRRKTKASLIFIPYLTPSLCEKLLIAWLSSLLGRRTIISIRSEVKPQGRFERTLRPLFRRALNRCHVVILQSERAQAGLERIYPKLSCQIEIIPNWIDCNRQQRVYDLNVSPTREPRILFIGWLEAAKGTLELLESIRLLNDRGLRCQLALCGSGSQADELPLIASELGIQDQVTFHGWVDDEKKIEQIQASDLLVLPSHTEGMPNSVLEAMASGLPVVATNVGSIPQLVDHERGGFLIDPKQPQQLADAIYKIVSCPEAMASMGNHNRGKVLRHHDVERAWRTIADLLNVVPSDQITDLAIESNKQRQLTS